MVVVAEPVTPETGSALVAQAVPALAALLRAYRQMQEVKGGRSVGSDRDAADGGGRRLGGTGAKSVGEEAA